jgi:acetyl-CoA acetyltransferase
MAIATGVASVVVCYRAFNERSGQRFGQVSLAAANAPTTSGIDNAWHYPMGLGTPASTVAMAARRYMHKFGASSLDFGRVAVTSRAHAATNPHAWFYGSPLTLEEHQASRWIVEPLRLFDCCQESDGGCAQVIVSAKKARAMKSKGALIRGVAQAAGRDQENMTSFYRPSISYLPEMDLVAKQVYAQSGMSPKEMDAAIIYDAFTPVVMWQLESWGFCGRGEAKDFVTNGNLEVGGALPCNTHGGQLSEAYIHGMNGVNEGVRLIRGESLNQPKKNDHVLVTAGVGVPTSGMILGQL